MTATAQLKKQMFECVRGPPFCAPGLSTGALTCASACAVEQSHCRNKTEVSQVHIPYAAKLLFQEVRRLAPSAPPSSVAGSRPARLMIPSSAFHSYKL